MSIALKTRDGRYITQPISHPATDEQVTNAIKNYFDENGVSTYYDVTDLRTQVYGESADDLPDLIWTIGRIDGKNGELIDDDASMRIRCQKITTKVNTIITFKNTSKYYHRVFVYDLQGTYLPDESDPDGWMTASTFTIAGDRIFCILVREQNYTVWDDDKIAVFSSCAKADPNPIIGLLKSVSNLENYINDIPRLEKEIRSNKNSISGLILTVGSMEMNTNILFNYDTEFFGQFENGEISWENGEDINDGSLIFTRSVEYKKVQKDGMVFVANIPSTALHSYYSYTYDDETGKYTWLKASSWYTADAAFKPEKGVYYRCLVYEPENISSNDVSIALCDNQITNLLNQIAAKYGNEADANLLDVQLSTEENTELKTTIASIKNASDSNTALIAFQTDLHITCGKNEDYLQQNSTKIQKYLSRYNSISKECKVDMLVFGGDYLDNNKNTDKETASASLKYLGSLMKRTRTDAPRFVIKGNHDDNTMYLDVKNGVVNDEERFAILSDIDQDKTQRDADNIQKTYGYYDIPNKKIRVFMLNTIDIPQVLDEDNNSINYAGQHITGFSQSQLQFVADHLKFQEAGWQVILFSHHPISNDLFEYEFANNQRAGVTPEHGGDSMVEILNAFKEGTAGTCECTTKDFESSVSYDFTDNKSNIIIANVHGHIHSSGVNKFGNDIYAVSTRAIFGHPSYANWINDCAIYLVINRKERKLYCISDGYGEDSELEY